MYSLPQSVSKQLIWFEHKINVQSNFQFGFGVPDLKLLSSDLPYWEAKICKRYTVVDKRLCCSYGKRLSAPAVRSDGAVDVLVIAIVWDAVFTIWSVVRHNPAKMRFALPNRWRPLPMEASNEWKISHRSQEHHITVNLQCVKVSVRPYYFPLAVQLFGFNGHESVFRHQIVARMPGYLEAKENKVSLQLLYNAIEPSIDGPLKMWMKCLRM